MKQVITIALAWCVGNFVGYSLFNGVGLIVTNILSFILIALYELHRLYKIKNYKFKVYVESDDGSVKVYRYKTRDEALRFLNIMELNNVSAYISED